MSFGSESFLLAGISQTLGPLFSIHCRNKGYIHTVSTAVDWFLLFVHHLAGLDPAGLGVGGGAVTLPILPCNAVSSSKDMLVAPVPCKKERPI